MGSSRSLHTTEYGLVRDALKRLRHEAGLTQRALGQRMDRPYSFVYKCEAGERRIDPLELIAWCWACGAEPEDVNRHLARDLRQATRFRKFPRNPS